MHKAASRGSTTDVRRLVTENRARLDHVHENYTPMMVATIKGHAEVVQELLNLGADKEKQCPAGATAVHLACEYDQSDILRILADAGAAVDNPRHTTLIRPLSWAVYCDSVKCIDVLLDRYREMIEIDAQDDSGDTALHVAVEYGTSEALGALLDAGADPSIRNNAGRTPLEGARFYGNRQEIVELLLDEEDTVVEMYQEP